MSQNGQQSYPNAPYPYSLLNRAKPNSQIPSSLLNQLQISSSLLNQTLTPFTFFHSHNSRGELAVKTREVARAQRSFRRSFPRYEFIWVLIVNKIGSRLPHFCNCQLSTWSLKCRKILSNRLTEIWLIFKKYRLYFSIYRFIQPFSGILPIFPTSPASAQDTKSWKFTDVIR